MNVKPSERPIAPRPLVLVIDPDRMSSLIISRILEKSGFAVECVGDAAGGLEVVAQRQASVVICEIRLPDIPIGAFLAKARALYAPAQLPVFVMAADLRPPQRIELLEAGVLDCLIKPVDAAELQLRIARALQNINPPVAATAIRMSGNLECFGLSDVLTMLDLTRYTGRMEIAGSREHGTIDLVTGRPVHAIFGSRVGMDAFCSIMRLAKGWFRVFSTAPSEIRTLCGSTTHLILEASVTEAHRRRTPSIRAHRLDELGVIRSTPNTPCPDRSRLAARLALQIMDPLRLGELEVSTHEAHPDDDAISIAMFGEIGELVGLLWEQSAPISPDLLVQASRGRGVLRWVFHGRQNDKLVIRMIGLEEQSSSWFHGRCDVALVAAPQAGMLVVDPAVRAYVLTNQLPVVLAAHEHETSVFSPAPFNTFKVLGKRLHELRGQGRSVIADALRLVQT